MAWDTIGDGSSVQGWNTLSFHETGDKPEQTHSHPLVKMDMLLTCPATQKAFPVLRWVAPPPAWNLLTKYCECPSLHPRAFLFTLRFRGLEDQHFTSVEEPIGEPALTASLWGYWKLSRDKRAKKKISVRICSAAGCTSRSGWWNLGTFSRFVSIRTATDQTPKVSRYSDDRQSVFDEV